MKKMKWGLYGVGMALILTSCVAKKKYTEAQNRISQLEQQNADCVSKTESLNTNLSTLQKTNSDLQNRYDSSINAYSSQQGRLNNYTTYYNTQKSTADQMHQTLHQQLDDKIGASNIVLANNKVYITLPESTLFTSGSTSLSSKGKDIVTTLASTIAQNPDVEVYVATSATYTGTGTAMGYDSGNGSTSMNNGSLNNGSSMNNGTMNNGTSSTNRNNSTLNNGTTNNGSTYGTNGTTNGTNGTYNGTAGSTNNGSTRNQTNATSNNGSSNGSYSNGTYNNNSASGSYSSTSRSRSGYKSSPKSGTRKSTASYASNGNKKSTRKYKSESSNSTMRSSYASSGKPSSSSMAVARASTIVSALRQGGVQKAGIQVTDPVNGASSSPRKYQVIVSPSMDGYYDMMGKETGMK
jgi:hypothetical protein